VKTTSPTAYSSILLGSRKGRRARRQSAEFGRDLPQLFEETGLMDVRAQCAITIERSGSEGASLIAQSLATFMPRAMRAGVVHEEDAERLLGIYRDPGFRFMSPLFVFTSGRRPDRA
jgi:hypothetical protein